MKKILIIILLLFILTTPTYAYNNEDLFIEYKNTYFQDETNVNQIINALFNNLSGNSNSIDLTQFSNLKKAYQSIFADDGVQLSKRMINDFNSFDLNKDEKLTIEEFKAIAPIWCYYLCANDYKFFKDTDYNNDGLIDGNEFGNIGYLFAEDTFWKDYSIEEICIVEFESANSNDDDYLNFTEFRRCLGY